MPVVAASQTPNAAPDQTNQKLPNATDVLEHFTTAVGGRSAILKHDSITTRGKIELPVSGAQYDYVTYLRMGKKLDRVSTLDGKLIVQDGIYGDLHWHVDSTGATILTGDVPDSLHRDSDPFYWGLTQINYFEKMETVGTAEFAQRACYHLRGITKWGEENNYFFDRESGLLLGFQWQSKQPNVERSPVTVVLANYHDFGGRMFPLRTTRIEGADILVETTETVDYGPLDESAFPVPDEVKKLIPAVRGTSAKPM